jgi:hypothetical protein
MGKKNYKVEFPFKVRRVPDSAVRRLAPGLNVFAYEPLTDPVVLEIDLDTFDVDRETFEACTVHA